MNEGPRLSGVGMLRFAAEHLGMKKVACVAWNIPGTIDWLCNGFAAWGKKHGVTVQNVIVDPSSPTTPRLCCESAASGPTPSWSAFTKGAIIQALTAAEDQDMGKTYKFFRSPRAMSWDFPKRSARTGTTGSGPSLNSRRSMAPARTTRTGSRSWTSMASSSDPRDTFSQGGYLAAKIATEAMLKLDPAKIDRASVADALRAVKDFHSDMMCGPWYFGNGARHNANHTGMIAVAHDGGWKTGGGASTIDDPELDDIFAAEKNARTRPAGPPGVAVSGGPAVEVRDHALLPFVAAGIGLGSVYASVGGRHRRPLPGLRDAQLRFRRAGRDRRLLRLVYLPPVLPPGARLGRRHRCRRGRVLRLRAPSSRRGCAIRDRAVRAVGTLGFALFILGHHCSRARRCRGG